MTSSQIKAVLGAIAAVCAAILPQLNLLPPEYAGWVRVVSVVGAAAGALVAVFNQSLSGAHVSVPLEEARRLGLDPGSQGSEVK